jgi:hypothetical protein
MIAALFRNQEIDSIQETDLIFELSQMDTGKKESLLRDMWAEILTSPMF